MNDKEALLEVIKACQREQDSDDDPDLTKKILEILDDLDDQENAIKIVVVMRKFAMSEGFDNAAICCIEFSERKALEAAVSQKTKATES